MRGRGVRSVRSARRSLSLSLSLSYTHTLSLSPPYLLTYSPTYAKFVCHQLTLDIRRTETCKQAWITSSTHECVCLCIDFHIINFKYFVQLLALSAPLTLAICDM